eukprot:626516-Pelagomonas_calceolata.AAC.1
MVWRITTIALMGLQRSACCRCAASNCCPGLVSGRKYAPLFSHVGSHDVSAFLNQNNNNIC